MSEDSSEEVELLGDPLSKLELPSLLAKVHEELCNFVSIHAGCRHLDCTCPIEVIMAEIESQLLDH